MNTVKRWLAGFLSFAMIFTSAAFTNVGSLVVAAKEVDKDDKSAVAMVTVGSTISYWDDIDDAINEALTDDDMSKKTVVKLLGDAEATINNVDRPLFVDFNGYDLEWVYAEDAVDEDPVEFEKGTHKSKKAYMICAAEVLGSGSAVKGYSFAIHNPEESYKWEFDDSDGDNDGSEPMNPIWQVTGIEKTCTNCGTVDAGLPYYDNDEEDPQYPLFENFYDENLKQYQYFEYPANYKDYEDIGSIFDPAYLKSTMSAEGYSIVEGPAFQMDGNKIVRDEKGEPIVTVKVLKNADGSVVETPAVVKTVASDNEKAHNEMASPRDGSIFSDGETFKDYEDWGVATPSTCYSTGWELYKVIVNDPDGNELTTKYIVDWDVPMVAHNKGLVDSVQFLTRVGNDPVIPTNENGEVTKGTKALFDDSPWFATEGEAMDAAAKAIAEEEEGDDDHTVIKITRKRVDLLNGKKNYEEGDALDGVVDTTVYFFWYWRADRTWNWSMFTTEYYQNLDFTPDALAIDDDNYDQSIVEEDGSFQYRAMYHCSYWSAQNQRCSRIIEGEAITVKPMADELTSDDYVANHTAMTSDNGYKKPIKSTCEIWYYEPIKIDYEYLRTVPKEQKVKGSITYSTDHNEYAIGTKTGISYFSHYDKPEDKQTHQPDGEPVTSQISATVVGTPATCYSEGRGIANCKICGKHKEDWVVEKLNVHSNKDGAHFEGDTPDCWTIDPAYLEEHTVTPNKYGDTYNTMMTVEPTCTEAGGDYLYCTNPIKDGVSTVGHWYLVKTLPAPGHKLSTTITMSNKVNEPASEGISYWMSRGDWELGEEGIDYVLYASRKCENERDMYQIVRYHSVAGTDTETDIYNAVKIVKEAAGKNCITPAKTTYTVESLTDSATKKPVTIGFVNSTVVGSNHEVKVKTFKWTNDFKKATAVGSCNLCTREGVEIEATVTQETSKDGITTFTATANGKTETKKAFSLKDAIVTFDASTITDGNAVKYGDDLPDVTVTINGTVIDPSLYETDWSYSSQKKRAIVEVSWTEAVRKSGKANFVVATKKGSAQVDAAKQFISKWTYDLNGVIQMDAEEITGSDMFNAYPAFNMIAKYDPKNTYNLVPAIIPDDATIKYAVLDKAIDRGNVEKRDDYAKYMKKVNALTYDKDEVVIHDAGKYYIYAEITKDGYTTWRGFVATFIIVRPQIYVQIDDLTITVGDDAESKLSKRAYWAEVSENAEYSSFEQGGPANSVANVDWAEDFTITTVGGKALKDLNAGTYKLNVQAPNYNIVTVNETHIGTLTVNAKDDATVAAEKVAEQLKNAKTDAELAAAYKAYAALTEDQQKIVKADNAAAALLDKAKAASDAADKAAADKKALDEATAAANTALSAANAYASDANIKALIDALNAAIAKGDTTAIKTATANLNNAVDAKKKADAKTKTTFTYKNAKKTIKASKVKKAKQKFTFKAKAKSGGKVTYKKASGSKKVTINSKGKVTVKKGTKKGTYKIKVKCTAAAKGNFLKTTVTKQITVKVK